MGKAPPHGFILEKQVQETENYLVSMQMKQQTKSVNFDLHMVMYASEIISMLYLGMHK